MTLDELERKVLKLVTERSGATVEELVDELSKVGYKKYDAFKAIEALTSKKLVELFESPEKFDPYRPAWTKSVYPTDKGKKLVEEMEKTEEEKTCSVTLVLTHPFPTTTSVKYISFLEAVELLFSENEEILGVVGFVDAKSLVATFGPILQKLRKQLSVKLLCTKIIPENDELKKKDLETLEAMGIRLKLAEVRDEHGRNLHAKFLTSGDLSYVGSHNLLKPALSKNLEVGLLVRDKDLAEELKKTFWELWRSFRVR